MTSLFAGLNDTMILYLQGIFDTVELVARPRL